MAILNEVLLWGPWVVAAFVWFGRTWILERVKRSIGHTFDEKLESLRAEFRKSEEQFKSDLREKESEISVLRHSVLSGSAGRQAHLDKKRFEAVEKIWTAVNDMAPLKPLSAFMAILKFDVVAKQVADPKMQTFLSMIGAGSPDLAQIKNVARDERPFLPDLAWAYFSAYQMILYSNHLRYKILKTGLDEPQKFISSDPARTILKAALPHHSKWIDENDAGAYHSLLEELESNLLAELRKILEGKEADQEAVARAKIIMDTVKNAESEQAEKAAASIKG